MSKAPDRWHIILGVLLLLGMGFRLLFRDPGAIDAAAPQPAKPGGLPRTAQRSKEQPPAPRPPTEVARLRREVTLPGSLPPQRPEVPGDDGQVARRPIDPSTATAEELETLPSIGPALARRIVEYRGVHGNFASLDDLQRVRGIGPGVARRLAPHVTFGASGRPSVVTSGAEGSVRTGARRSRRADRRTLPD
jgi:competence protein ComEA